MRPRRSTTSTRPTRFPVDRVVGDASAEDYDALMLPGGVANPDNLRTHPEAVAFVRAFFDAGKPVAAICHAPWTLVEADVVAGRTLTSWPSLQTDLRNAGGDVGRRGGRRRRQPRHVAQARRPAGVQRQDDRGARIVPAARAARKKSCARCAKRLASGTLAGPCPVRFGPAPSASGSSPCPSSCTARSTASPSASTSSTPRRARGSRRSASTPRRARRSPTRIWSRAMRSPQTAMW